MKPLAHCSRNHTNFINPAQTNGEIYGRNSPTKPQSSFASRMARSAQGPSDQGERVYPAARSVKPGAKGAALGKGGERIRFRRSRREGAPGGSFLGKKSIGRLTIHG